MNQALIHGQLSLSYPDGFREMGREEMKALYQDDNPDRWGIWDQDRHIIVAVLWHDSSPALAALAGAKDVAKTTEKRLKRRILLISHRLQRNQLFRIRKVPRLLRKSQNRRRRRNRTSRRVRPSPRLRLKQKKKLRKRPGISTSSLPAMFTAA